LRVQLPSRMRGGLRRGWASAFTSDRAIFRALLALIAALAAIGVTIDSARAQQYFNGAQTTPNAAINGGGGVWDSTTTNWTTTTGTASNPYDPTAATVTAFGASGSSTPATGGTVVVNPGGIQLTSTVQFNATGDNSIYTIQGGNLTVAAGGTSFNISNVAASGASAVIASSVVGTDGISVFGPGTLLLSGVNTYAGGTFICSCASLQLGDATHTASIVGAVDNEGLFNIFNANTAGITSITNNGGEVSFSNATSASTAQITNNGDIFFFDTSTAGSAHITNQLGVTAFGTPGGTDTSTAGNATITNNNGGTLFFAMTNAGTANITNRNSGATEFFEQSDAGSATIVNRFSGVTIFNDFSSAMNASITSRFGGETDFHDQSSADNATITNRFGGSTLFFDRSSAGNATIVNGSFGGPFSLAPVGLGFFDHSTAGTATIINNNNGLIAFGVPFGFDSASADHANITNNSGGSLEFNAFTTAGNATITTNSGGAVAFFDNSTGGNAQFITNGTGFVDFSASVGPNSDFRISAGSIAGSGTYYIGAGNTLTVGSNNLSTTVSGVIADYNPSPPCGCPVFPGPGFLEKVGTGTLTLSGPNTYTGTTTVFGGGLDVEGSIASSVLTTVNAGGALSGAGIVGNTAIAGGILMPGNGAPGSFMTVAGNLAFRSGAQYLVMLNSTASTFANVVGNATLTGTATLAGTVGVAFLPGSEVVKQYMILAAKGGVSGGFAGVSLPSPSGGLVATLSYDPTHAYLNFAVDFGVIPGLNVNQRNVGTTLTNFFNANGGIPVSFATLTPGGLTQVSGELATGSQQATFDAMNLFLGLLTDPFVAGRGGSPTSGTGAPAGYASTQNVGTARDAYAMFTKAPLAQVYDPRWSVWAAGYGGSQTSDGNTALGSNTATSSVYGTAVGADYRISPFTVAGFALAGGGTNFSVAGSGSGHSDLFQAGAFIRHTIGQAYITAALAYGWQDITTNRTVTVAGSDQLRAQFDANAFSGRLEGGYRFVAPWVGGVGITPYAAAQFTTFDLPAYAEQAVVGSNAFALSYNAKDVTDTRSELGIRTDKSWAMTDGILTLRGRVAWAHDYDPDRSIAATFQTLPGASFVVNGAAQAADSALVTASVEKKWLNGWSAAATFEGEFSDVTRSYAGKGVVRYLW
jgi:autotransporter-associated beta strand protein